MITGEQVKAAREMLGWSRSRLAARSVVSDATVSSEGGKRPRERTVMKISRALEAADVELIAENGEPRIRLRKGVRSGNKEHADWGLP
jgi:transcriptional regulator with XRE-family HTH domain